MLNFNSIKVRLKLDDAQKEIYSLLDFNSIKVRLKPDILGSLSSAIHKFQFHKGTIKTLSLKIAPKAKRISIP